MYYNKKIMFLNILLCSIITLFALLSMFSVVKYPITGPIFLTGLGLQQFLLAYNSYKKNEKGFTILSMISGIFVIGVAIFKTYVFNHTA